MSFLVFPSDFVGSVAITQNQFDNKSLKLYIDENETDLINDLLGCELGGLVIDYIKAPTSPPVQRYEDIINKFCIDLKQPLPYYSLWPFSWVDYYQCYCMNKQNKSRGLKEMLKGLIYLLYTRDQPTLNTSVGAAKSKGVASDLVPVNQLIGRYNRSINDYWNIQYFIVCNSDVYPEFNGVTKGAITII